MDPATIIKMVIALIPVGVEISRWVRYWLERNKRSNNKSEDPSDHFGR